MKTPLLSSPHDYMALVDRRRWWIIAGMSVGALIALLTAVVLPNVYRSETLILIKPQDVPDNVIQDFVTWNTQQRLISIEEQVLSRTHLLRVIKEFPGGFRELAPLPDDRKVEVLQSRIEVDVAADRRGRDSFVPYFRISYHDRDPRLAQQVTDRLAALFIQADQRTRAQPVIQTAQFLDAEVAKVASELAQAEEELAVLKRRFGNQLPEQLEANLRTLDRLQQQLSANSEQRDRYLAMKLNLQRGLSETEPFLPGELRARGVTEASGRRESPQVLLYRQKELILQELLARYTDKHPDVKRLRAELKGLEDEIPPEELLDIQDPLPVESATQNEPNPTYQRLNSQLLEVNTELRIAEENRTKIENGIDEITRRVMNTPEIEQRVLAVQRRYLSLQAQYDDLRERQSQAELARSLENNQKGEQFQVVDQANFPYRPSKPNRWLVLGVGLAISCGIGLVLAGTVDLVDQKVYSYAEIEKLLGAPVLAEIPRILTDRDKKRLQRHSMLRVATMLLVVGLGLVVVYSVYSTPSLRNESAEYMARLLKW